MTLLLKAFVWIVVTFLILGLALFLPAGTVQWAAGCVYLILLLGYWLVIIGVLYVSDCDLLRERLSISQPHQNPADRALMPLVLVVGLAWYVLMALDAVRFQWSHMPLFLQVIGAILIVSSIPVVLLTFRENTFATTAVRVQEERGQRVISTGPYYYVRHPLYAGSLLLFVGTPLLLGSWFGLVFAIVPIVGLGMRAILEESVLREELPGYDTYMKQVRYRFVPHAW